MVRRSLPRPFALALLIAPAFTARAQQYPLTLSTTVYPPYTASYVEYFQNPAQLSVSITNQGIEPRQIYLAGSIATLDGNIAVRVDGGQAWNAGPLYVPANMTTTFNGTDLEPFVTNSGSQVQYIGITEEDIRLGLLPEGEYQVCLQAFDYNTNEPLSAGAPSDGCSNPFTITYPPPPTLQFPTCGETVHGTIPQNLFFSWMLPSGPPIGAVVRYHFKLVMLPEDPSSIDPLSALQSSGDPVYEDDQLIAPSLLYGPTMPNLIPGRSYAWYVQAVDITGQHPFQNEGFSEPCVFKWSILSGSNFNLAYPHNMDTIPWDLVPVMVQFEPHQDPQETGRFHSTLTLFKDGVQHSITERKPGDEDILWNSGPYLSQRYLLYQAIDPDPFFNEEQAHHINVYRNDALGEGRFKRGSTYSAVAQVRIDTYAQTDPIEGEVQGSFVVGMGRPRPLAPANNAELPRNSEEGASGYTPVALRFRTSETPFEVRPPFPIWIIPETGQPTQTQATVHERWVLQVARDAAFTDVVHTADAVLGTGLQLNGPSCDNGCVEAALYKEETVNFTPNADGTYFWRVRWMKDPNSTTGPTYHDGPVWRFTIGDGGTTTPGEEEQIPPAQCLAESRRAPTPAGQRSPVTTIQVGDTVQVGLFKMKVGTIAYSGTAANGEGLVDVPVMRAQLRVRFVNARINAQKRLYDGEVTGLYDNAGIIPPAWATGTALAAGFNPEAAQAIDDYLNTAGRLISQFSGTTPMGLPIGLDKETEAGRIVIGILGVQFTDTIARLNAGMALPMHELGETVGLGNMAIPFHPGGIGDVTEEATLYLLGDLDLPIGADTLKLKGARFAEGFTTVQDSGTFVAWDCQGFRAVTFDLEYRFDRDKLREDLPNGDDGPRKVVGSLRVRTGRAGIMGRLDFNTPFHLTHAKDWGFDVQEAWLDLANYANAPDMHLPAAHAFASGLITPSGGIDPAWTGVYVKRTMLRLPHAIERFEGTGRVTAQVDDFIYGFGEGVSASFKVSNILDTDQGKLDGWGFSLDTLQMDIVLNTFSQGGFKGRIRLPISDTLLVYSGMIQHSPTTNDTRFEFLLHPDGTLNVPMYVGNIALLETSTVRATFGDAVTGTSARADLNGKLSVEVNALDKVRLNFRDIAFQGLFFQTDAPYTNAGDQTVFSLASPQKWMGGAPDEDEEDNGDGDGSGNNKAGGFPVSITKVKTERRDSEGNVMAGLSFDINLDLSGTTNTFVATTRIALLGTLNTTSLHQWGHHEIELDSIGVTGETGAVKIIAGLRWYHEDPVYGNGINGRAKAWFLKGALEVAAAVQFGNVNGTRYWFADAMLAKDGGFSPGNPFNVYGFGGGAWYHMKRMSEPPSAAQVTQADLVHQNDDDYTPGLTLSEVVYRPDAGELFGFKATVIFGDGAGGKAYNGDLIAGMTFSTSGGVNTAFLDGNVFMLRDRQVALGAEEEVYAPIRGTAHIQFDFPNDVFTANFTMFAKVTKKVGQGATQQEFEVMVGTGANGLAGAANLFISPETWYFHVGTPQTPIGLRFGDLFSTTAYLMVGELLPDPMPMADDSVAALVRRTIGDFHWPAEAGNASGIAFGARAQLDKDIRILLLKLGLHAAVGFDMAFLSAGSMECEDVVDPGFAGMYATGQVFAYLRTIVELHVDLWFVEGDYTVMDATAAAILHGGFANPSWARGLVACRFELFGGAVSGDISHDFEVGEPCRPYGSGGLAGLDPIDDIVPRNKQGITPGTEAVYVGVSPSALFNMKLDTPFVLKEMQANGSTKEYTYRLKLDDMTLTGEGEELSGATVTAPDKREAAFSPGAYLQPKTVHKFRVKLRAEKRNSSGGWDQAVVGGKEAVWDTTVTFKTGEGIRDLSANDIDYTYPFTGQRYLLQDECRNGIIRCKRDMMAQPLFHPAEVPPGRTRVYKVMFSPLAGGATIATNATLGTHQIPGDNNTTLYPTTINFPIPQLQNNATYVLQFIARDSLVDGGGRPGMHQLDSDILAGGSNMMMGEGGFTTTSSQTDHGMGVRTVRRVASGYRVRANEKLLYTFHFRTSGYNTIADKSAAFTTGFVLRNEDGQSPPEETFTVGLNGEPFDVYDVLGFSYREYGTSTMPPLISMQDAHTDRWSNEWAEPTVYDYYAEIKRRACSSMQLERTVTESNSWYQPQPVIRDNPDHIGKPPVHTVSWDPTKSPAQPLSSSETVPPPMFGVMGGGAQGLDVGNGFGGGGPTYNADVKLLQVTPKWVRKDYVRLQTITADVINNCGPLGGETPMADPLRSMVLAYQAGYKEPWRGNYGLTFNFVSTPTCANFGDGYAPDPLGTGTAVYNCNTGPYAPMPGAAGTGATQGIQSTGSGTGSGTTRPVPTPPIKPKNN